MEGTRLMWAGMLPGGVGALLCAGPQRIYHSSRHSAQQMSGRMRSALECRALAGPELPSPNWRRRAHHPPQIQEWMRTGNAASALLDCLQQCHKFSGTTSLCTSPACTSMILFICACTCSAQSLQAAGRTTANDLPDPATKKGPVMRGQCDFGVISLAQPTLPFHGTLLLQHYARRIISMTGPSSVCSTMGKFPRASI